MLLINRRRPQAAIAAFLALAMAGSAIAAPLVVRSAGPSAKIYPAGKALADDAKLTLKANDTVVLLDGKGTRTLTGPGTFSASSSSVAASSAGSTIVALASSGGSRARTGAVRSVSGVDTTGGRNPNVWFVDLNRSANMCVADPSTVTVWRHDAAEPTVVTVTRASDGAKATLDLPAGKNSGAWPSTLAVTDGSQFKLSWPGAKAPTSLKFVIVQSTSAGLEDMAQSLIKAGCNAQLDLLIETVSLPSHPAG